MAGGKYEVAARIPCFTREISLRGDDLLNHGKGFARNLGTPPTQEHRTRCATPTLAMSRPGKPRGSKSSFGVRWNIILFPLIRDDLSLTSEDTINSGREIRFQGSPNFKFEGAANWV